MPEEVSFVPEAMRSEAKKWLALSDEMAKGRQEANARSLGPTSFILGPNPMDFLMLSTLYDEAQSSVAMLLSEAQAEFDEMADALKELADLVEVADAGSAIGLEKVFDPTQY